MKFNHINRRIEDFNGVEQLNCVVDNVIEQDYKKLEFPPFDGNLLFEPLSGYYRVEKIK